MPPGAESHFAEHSAMDLTVIYLRPYEEITSGNGRYCSEREVASSYLKGLFLADGSAKGVRHFCTHHKKKHFCCPKCGFPIGSSWKQQRNIIPVPPRTSEGRNMEQ
jgi:hypothetical protein